MALRIGLNGFGRIGRYLTRLLAHEKDIELVINARATNEDLARLLKYDSVHGKADFEVGFTDDGLIINGKHCPVTREATSSWLWRDYNIDIAVESTGTIKDRDALAKHLEQGAKKVIMSAPAKNADVTIVMGVNQDDYDAAKHDVISAASCTTNCLAPAAKVINECFGIKHALMTTIHSYTMSQRILDGSHKDPRRSRACAMSMIPTTTGAAKATGLVYPKLKGKIDGSAIRVPVPNVSLVDLTAELEKKVTAEEVNAILKEASETFLKGNMGFNEEPLVSIDYTGMTQGGVVDAMSTAVMDETMLKLVIWYDNEAGFTNQLLRLIKHVGKEL